MTVNTARESDIQVGVFIRDKRRGFGKVVELGGGRALVEFFSSPSVHGRDRVSFQVQALSPVVPPKGTRCFVREDDGGWWIGRMIGVVRSAGESPDYQVLREGSPDSRPEYPSGRCVYVRCTDEIPDPVDVMKCGALHSPVSAHLRSNFIAQLLRQRRLSGGLTGLTSSKIDLHRHQVEIAQRVLSDPIQRYLLADEVGLGKTIEAGIIIRQFLIDEPTTRVLVCVPQLLVGQWKRELVQKFRVDDWPGRWNVVGYDGLMSDGNVRGVGLLVIDEVHNLFMETESTRVAATRTSLQEAAHAVPRLLLLSATPLLHNEQVFLGMLNLLDPAMYRTDQLPWFKEQVAAKQDLARQLQSFTEDSGAWLLEGLANDFKDRFPSDATLQAQLDAIVELLQVHPEGSNEVGSLVRTIRSHISETYRLHRRVLRTRRHSPLAEGFPVRGRRLASKPEWSSGRSTDRFISDLDEWTDEWMLRFGRRAEAQSLTRYEVVAVCGLMDRLQSLPSIVRAYCEVWLGIEDAESESGAVAELSDSELEALAAVRLSDDEHNLLLGLLGMLLNDDRLEDMWLERALKSIDAVPKSLTFCGFDGAVRSILHAAESPNLHVRPLLEDGSPGAALEWLDVTPSGSLLCGRRAEEGFNAQWIPRMLHLHLPWDPSRLEQRIGRADRFGSGGPVEIHLPMATSQWMILWARFLDEALHIFDESIASLQHVIGREVGTILSRFMTHGSDQSSWMGIAREMRESLARERDDILALEALESIEVEADERSQRFDMLCEARSDESDFSSAALDWLGRGGREVSVGLEFRHGGLICVPGPGMAMGIERETVLSELGLDGGDVAIARVGRQQRRFGYGPDQSELVRCHVGSPFIRDLESLTAIDDLGQTFGFRRRVELDGSQLIAQLALRIDGSTRRIRLALADELSRVEKGLAWEALARTVDALLPPHHLILHFDVDGAVISGDLERLASAPFASGHDTPLQPSDIARLEVAFNVSWRDWWNRCHRAALEFANTSLELEQLRAAALEGFDKRAANLRNQLELRVNVEADSAQVAVLEQDLRRQLAAGQLARSVLSEVQPMVETVGVVILESRPSRTAR